MKEIITDQSTVLTCIRCPLGCQVSAWKGADGTVIVTGNGCPRGAEYAMKELTSPTRVLTTTVRVLEGKHPVVPVKTNGDVPKGKIMDCIAQLKEIELKAPVKAGTIVIENIADTGVAVITTAAVLG